MSAAVKGICLVGVADVAYRVLLRGYVRRQVGVEHPSDAALTGAGRVGGSGRRPRRRL